MKLTTVITFHDEWHIKKRREKSIVVQRRYGHKYVDKKGERSRKMLSTHINRNAYVRKSVGSWTKHTCGWFG